MNSMYRKDYDSLHLLSRIRELIAPTSGTGAFVGPFDPEEPATFFVNNVVGSDAVDGLDPRRPFKTLQKAIDSCVAQRGDVIVVARGTETVTASVNFNKRGITVIARPSGFTPYASGERFTLEADATFTSGPVAAITKPCTIIGMGFLGRQVAGPSVLASFGTGGFDSGGWSYLYRCWFPNHNGIARGLDLAGVDRTYIEECVFDGSNNGALTAGGKRLTEGIRLGSQAGGACHNCYILNCEFINATTAINVVLATPKSDPVHGNAGCVIKGNRMLAVPGTQFFLDVEDVAGVRPQVIMVSDNDLGVAKASQAYKLGGAAQATLTALVTAGLQFANNRYAETV